MSNRTSKYAAKKAAGNQMYGPNCCGHKRDTGWLTGHKWEVARIRRQAGDSNLAVPPFRKAETEKIRVVPATAIAEQLGTLVDISPVEARA